MGTSVHDIRRRKREQRLLELRRDAATALTHHPNGSLWLFGS